MPGTKTTAAALCLEPFSQGQKGDERGYGPTDREGVSPDDMYFGRFGPDLRRPVGRIRWACTDIAGIGNMHMEGALRSGKAAAAAIAAGSLVGSSRTLRLRPHA